MSEWSKRWKAGPDSRQTRLFFQDLNPKKSDEIRKLKRNAISPLVRALSGHDFRNRHNTVIENRDFGKCRLCQEGEENLDHFITECDYLELTRLNNFGYHVELKEIQEEWGVSQMVKFISDPIISALEETDTADSTNSQ